MDFRASFARLAAGMLSALTVLLAGPAHAGPSPHMNQAFGLIGLAPGQCPRLNVADTRIRISDRQDQPVDVQLFFYDESGNVLARNAGRLGPGESIGMIIDGCRVATPATDSRVARRLVRALVVAQLPPGPCADHPNSRACREAFQQLGNLRSSVEVLAGDVNGDRVALFVDNPDLIDDPNIKTGEQGIDNPDIKSGLFTVMAGQSAEIHVTNVVPAVQAGGRAAAGDGSVRVSLHFFDSQGNRLLAGEEVTLGPNQSTSLALEAAVGVPAVQRRAVVRGMPLDGGTKAGPSPHMRGVVNVVDVSSGKTIDNPNISPNPVLQ